MPSRSWTKPRDAPVSDVGGGGRKVRLLFYHDPMRKALAVLFLAMACASSNTPSRIHVDVFGQRSTLTGPRTYTVRITNSSEQVQTIHAISVRAASTSTFEFNSMPETVDTVLQPGESSDFSITVQVDIARGAPGDAGLAGQNDSVQVNISGQNETGTWVDSGTYSVNYVRSY